MPTPNKFAALDSNFLLALEAGDEDCSGVIDGLGAIGFYFIVTETVLQELSHIADASEDPEVCEHAKNALRQITNWGFLTPPLGAIEMGVAERVANDLISKLLTEGQINDGLVIVEAAYNRCKLFLTRRQIILSVNRKSIPLILIGADLPAILVASPSEMVTVLKEIAAQ